MTINPVDYLNKLHQTFILRKDCGEISEEELKDFQIFYNYVAGLEKRVSELEILLK